MLTRNRSTPPPVPAEPTWSIEVREAERVMIVTTGGPFTMKDFVAMVPQALGQAAEQDISRFVFDDRLMRPKLVTSEIYMLPQAFERLGWRRGMRVAVVFPQEHRAAGDFQFFANLAVARAFQYCLFTELDAAIAWATAGDAG
jgi:hypothetical protein